MTRQQNPERSPVAETLTCEDDVDAEIDKILALPAAEVERELCLRGVRVDSDVEVDTVRRWIERAKRDEPPAEDTVDNQTARGRVPRRRRNSVR